MERRLTTIVVADLVGFSRLMAADEEGVITRLRTCRADIVNPAVMKGGGRIIKTMGDGLLIEFTSPVEAVRACITIQTDMAEREQGPEDQRLRFRIGINLGDIVEDEGDVLGDGVNVAARLEALSAPGGACISRSVHDQMRGKVEVGLTPMGPQKVKNIPDPVDAWRVKIDGAAPAPMQFELPDRPSIVVLPFQNMSSDPDQEFFCNGMAEDVTTALSRFSQLFVVARNTAATFKGQNLGFGEISRALGVRYVLEGSVRNAGQRLRVTAQLVDASNDRQVWAEKYDGNVDDIFDFQDELTQRIVSAVAPSVRIAETTRQRQSPDHDLSIWSLLAKSGTERMTLSAEAVKRSTELAQKAISIDPDYAEAHVALADCYVLECLYGWNMTVPEAVKLHDEASNTAISLDRRNEFCLNARAMTLILLRRPGEAISLLRRAIEINPNEAQCIGTLGVALVWNRQWDESIQYLDQALRLSPRDQWSSFHMVHRAFAAYFSGDFELAAERANDVIAEYPSFPTAVRVRVAALGMLGQSDEAAKWLAHLEVMLPGVNIENSRKAVVTPFEDDVHLYTDGLRRAGMPE